MKTDNIIVDKSKRFALNIITVYKYLTTTKQEFVLSKQLLRSGTSIGANVKEAIRAQSRPDFINKLGIALKESSESEYWLELLYESGYIDNEQYSKIYPDCQELIKIITSIINSTKTNDSFDY